MADLTDAQSALTVKLVGANPSTGVEDNFVDVDTSGRLTAKLNDASGNAINLGQTTKSSSLPVTIASDQSTDGTVSAGTVASRSCLIGAQYNTALPALTNGQQSALQSDSSGRLLVGSIASALPTGANTIGAVNQGAPNSVANSWPIKITDDTNTAAVKAASTAPVATDPALVVTLSPNTPNLTISPLPATGSKFSFGELATSSSATFLALESTPYTETTTNSTMTLVSSSASDASAGTGARTVVVTYLDQTGAGPFTATFTMNGTTAVNSGLSNMCFVEKIVVATVGSTGSNVGTLTLKTGGGATVGTVTATINQTLWAHHYVPTGKTCYISGFSYGNSSSAVGNGGQFVLRASTPTVANTPEIQVSDFMTLVGGSNTNTRTYLSPIQVVGPARIKCYVSPYANAATTQFASFDFIDN